ncbi:GAF domain-containing protein [Jatrophihabitans sp. GAS493]|uniref:GAF domain-containing protein n=1 Tax=Jatrophihabitans sp. GAS493 TaxID=1907575 RepID=UPI00155FF8A5|nr:GAF domain-containing protein [Jatrophihabitans sp. GAS493]
MTISELFALESAGSGELYGEVVGAFEEVALLTTSDSAEINDVLRLVGQRLCELLKVSRCSVYLRRDDGRFQGQVGYCVGRRIDAGVSRLVAGVDDDQFTAEIVRTAAPVLVQNATQDPRTIQRTMRQWGVLDMLGVPLVVGGEVIGIIYVDNQGERHEYTNRDVKLAQAFAGLSALAVRQGWLYKQLGERARIIDEQRQVLGASAAVHNRVTRAVLDGADIDAILSLIVELLGKPVVLYGPKLEMLSWASPESLEMKACPAITPAQVELQWVQDALGALDDGRSTVMMRATPELRCRRLLVRMLIDRECVGYLELCELGRSFSQVDSKALEQAAMAVSLKLLSDQRNADIYRQEREEYFADILYGRRDLESLTTRAESFGFDVDRRHVVLRLQYADGFDDIDATGNTRRSSAAQLVSKSLDGCAKCVAYTGVPGADLLLLEVPVTETGAAGAALAEALSHAFAPLNERFGVRFAVVSDPCRSLGELPTAAEKIREIAGLLRDAATESRLVFARDLELIRLVTRRDGIQGALKHAEDLLSPLVEHDEANAGALVETLRAFVGSQAQIRATAATLGVHENTVRYRLNRIREVSSIEPERLDALLTVSVALQAQSLFATGLSRLSTTTNATEEV